MNDDAWHVIVSSRDGALEALGGYLGVHGGRQLPSEEHSLRAQNGQGVTGAIFHYVRWLNQSMSGSSGSKCRSTRSSG